MTYKCTIPGSRDGVRGGATLWRGTAFDCTSGQIFLLHARSPSSATCNNGNIVARGILDAYGTYTSQLNVTVTPDVAGKRVKCIYHDNYTQRISVEYSSQVPTIGRSLCRTEGKLLTEKPPQILKFCTQPIKFFSMKFCHATPTHSSRSFIFKILISYQFVKILSAKSFPPHK